MFVPLFGSEGFLCECVYFFQLFLKHSVHESVDKIYIVLRKVEEWILFFGLVPSMWRIVYFSWARKFTNEPYPNKFAYVIWTKYFSLSFTFGTSGKHQRYDCTVQVFITIWPYFKDLNILDMPKMVSFLYFNYARRFVILLFGVSNLMLN